MANKQFQFKGRGKDTEFKIIDLTLSPNITSWPPGDTVLALWAYIQPSDFLGKSKTSSNTTSLLDDIVTDYGAERAMIEKQRFERVYKRDEQTIQKTLEKSYGMGLKRTDRYLANLRKQNEIADTAFNGQLAREVTKVSEENSANSGKPDYVVKNPQISKEHELLMMERKALSLSAEQYKEIIEREDKRVKSLEDQQPSENLDTKVTSTAKYKVETKEESETVIFEECADWNQKWCGKQGVQEQLYIAYLELK